MKVLALSWELPPVINGGMGVACQNLFENLGIQEGIELTVALPVLFGGERIRNCQLFSPGVGQVGECLRASERPLLSRGSAYDSGSLPSALMFAKQMDASAARFKDTKILHAHDWLTFPAAAKIRRQLACRVVAHVHSTEIERSGELRDKNIEQIEKQFLSESDHIITVSHVSKRVIVDRYSISPDRVSVVHNAGDHHPLQAGRVAHRDPIVSFVGRVTSQKGPLKFIQAARHISARLPSVRFVMAGDGDQLVPAQRLAAAFGLEPKIEFPGFVCDRDVQNILSNSAVYVMPSEAEPFGIGAVEAIRAGVPVVLAKHCGVCEVVKHLYRVRDLTGAGIAEAVLRCLLFPQRAAWRAKIAQKEVSSWSWENVATAVRLVYRNTFSDETTSVESISV